MKMTCALYTHLYQRQPGNTGIDETSSTEHEISEFFSGWVAGGFDDSILLEATILAAVSDSTRHCFGKEALCRATYKVVKRRKHRRGEG